MAKLGCLLIIVSVIALCILVVLPVLPFLAENETIDNILRPLICQRGETIIRDQYSYTDYEGTNFSMDVYCVGTNEVRRDETGRWILIGAGAFVVPFLIGLFSFIGGVQRKTRGIMINIGSNPLEDLQTHGVNFSMPFGSGSTFGAGVGTLTQRLQEVQDARDKGLISSEEYERLRKEILDSHS